MIKLAIIGMSLLIAFALTDAYRTHDHAEKIVFSVDINSPLETQIVTPFSPLLICDYYFADFDCDGSCNATKMLVNKKNLNVDVAPFIPQMSIVYVASGRFTAFFDELLPVIRSPFILITGQWQWPAVSLSNKTMLALEHPMVYHWYSQNPIFIHPKYTAIPYGIRCSNLPGYVAQLIKGNLTKTVLLGKFHFSLTNPERKKLPNIGRVGYPEYLQQLSASMFVPSPNGDRPDCYRHWEAIGFRTMPILNVPHEYRQLFGSSALYTDIDGMATTMMHSVILPDYYEPNWRLIYWKLWERQIMRKKKEGLWLARIKNEPAFNLSKKEVTSVDR